MEISKLKKIIEKNLNQNKAKNIIAIDLKNKSPDKINKIAIETSSDLVKQLIGVEVNNSSISAIVKDISRKT